MLVLVRSKACKASNNCMDGLESESSSSSAPPSYPCLTMPRRLLPYKALTLRMACNRLPGSSQGLSDVVYGLSESTHTLLVLILG
jgi:hypothetical protein